MKLMEPVEHIRCDGDDCRAAAVYLPRDWVGIAPSPYRTLYLCPSCAEKRANRRTKT